MSFKYTSFHVCINSIGLYLPLQNAYWILSQTFIFHHVWEKLLHSWISDSYKMHWFEAFLLIPNSKLALKFLSSSPRQQEITRYPSSILSRICFLHQQKGVEKTMICLIRISSENMKMTWNIIFFIYCMFCKFFKSNVMALQFCK